MNTYENSVQIAKYITEILPAMSIEELLEAMRAAARQDRFGDKQQQIAFIEAEIIERVSPTIEFEEDEEEEDENTFEHYSDEEVLYMYVEQIDENSNDIFDTEEEIINRMEECRMLRHGRAWNEYSDITDRDLLSMYEDSVIVEDEADEYKQEILRRMKHCIYLGH